MLHQRIIYRALLLCSVGLSFLSSTVLAKHKDAATQTQSVEVGTRECQPSCDWWDECCADRDCSAGGVCVDHSCEYPRKPPEHCSSDNDCILNCPIGVNCNWDKTGKCIDDTCVYNDWKCRIDSDCGKGGICFQGICTWDQIPPASTKPSAPGKK